MVDTLLATDDRLECFFRNYSDKYIPADGHYRPMKIDRHDLKELFATASWALVNDDTDDGYDDGNQLSDIELLDINTTSDCRRITSNTTPVGTIRSLSYSYSYPVKVGLSCDVFFFGDDPQEAARHAVAHAEHLATVWDGNIGFVLHVPAGLDVGPIDVTVQSVFDGPAQLEPMVIALRRLPEPEAIS